MNNRPSSPLRHLDLTDTEIAVDIVTEKARELSAAYERIENLQDAVKGLLWLIEFIAKRADISPDVREALTADHRVIDAMQVLS